MASAWLFAALLLVSPALLLAAQDKGVVYLDDLTFTRVIDGSKDVIVRVDKSYAWGDDHDQFKEFAKKVGGSSADVIVASVSVSKSDYDPENVELAAKLSASDESAYPVYKLYKKGSKPFVDQPLTLSGKGKKADALLQWLGQHTGAFFGLKGQLAEFHSLAQDFVKEGSDRQALLKAAEDKAKALVPGEEADHAAFYVKVMQKALEKPDFLTTETKRLRKMAEDKNVPTARKDAFQVKANILASFSGSGKGSKAEL